MASYRPSSHVRQERKQINDIIQAAYTGVFSPKKRITRKRVKKSNLDEKQKKKYNRIISESGIRSISRFSSKSGLQAKDLNPTSTTIKTNKKVAKPSIFQSKQVYL